MRFESLPNYLFVAFVIGLSVFYYQNRGKQQPVGAPNDANFEAAINGPTEFTLVKFGADWCPPCRAMEPVLDSLSTRMKGRVAVVKVNVDQQPALARHYQVRGIPKLVLMHHGQVVDELVGGRDVNSLERWINGAQKKLPASL